jgi:hypothetical protein
VVDEALRIAVDAPQHAGPGLADDQEPARPRGMLLAVAVDDRGVDPEERAACRSPAWSGVMPGSGVIMCPPVSVCHQVSTIGQFARPMTSRYHIHASGLIGSPTVPST